MPALCAGAMGSSSGAYTSALSIACTYLNNRDDLDPSTLSLQTPQHGFSLQLHLFLRAHQQDEIVADQCRI